ncbi:hypothetical protein BD324DRAFT_656473 [Kockovaella imperatae]|uniref:Protein kinase domain-containing protein n=1 Tax=Kockovaella imperatae TaxID=4999 RepID=A0A1Y1UIU0_9TREE|nr:hypothetical protein BD324DRAFT_656473 [Kockovaella imperatae]ORX37406.1 hypothetical protein BD324DRAFT_656473 [Kockovaella imperatae]
MASTFSHDSPVRVSTIPGSEAAAAAVASSSTYRRVSTTTSATTSPGSRRPSGDSYLPTPQSGSLFRQQQQQMQSQSHSQQRPPQLPLPHSTSHSSSHPSSHSASYNSSNSPHPNQSPHPTLSPGISPHPQMSNHLLTPDMSDHSGSPQFAGPSTYRRTPDLHSPLSHADYDDLHARGLVHDPSTPARGSKPRGRMTAQGEQVMMDGMERMQVDEGDGRIGTEDPFAERSYTELKVLGDGSFGTVWLCDWHSPVKPNVLLSAMQCGAGARPEWAGKRLVALKRMKRVWDGGWSQARNLGEIYSLSRIPQHPAIIPLYDAFISPKSKELYFVFECMEGNLYQLTKSRRGRPLAAGLIASCFHQVVSGLHHIHRYGYFHRDMKPENLLVTTTGLADYLTASTLTQINSDPGGTDSSTYQYEKDVSVIIKLADFGLARAITSKPPYTEYVSTRWYRAPEVLLRSTEYGAPVDMWALGTILAEMLNLKPLFPGVSEIDQVYRITDTLGDPSTDYGVDERGKVIGGGAWVSGVKLAKNVGFAFPKRNPVKFRSLFNENVPQSLVDCIADLLRYNPKYRMTSAQCIDHPYFHETLPHLQQTPPLPRIPFSQGQPLHRIVQPPLHDLNAPPRAVPPSHSHHEARPAFANGDMRTLPPPVGTPDHSKNIFSGPDSYEPSALVNQLRQLDLPTEDLASYGHRPPPSPVASSVYTTGGDATLGPAQRTRAWAEDTRQQVLQPVPKQQPQQQQHHHASSHYAHMNASQAKVAAFVEQQQSILVYEDGTPRQTGPGPLPPMPPLMDSPSDSPSASSSKLASLTVGKKKKWGLSSVFSRDDKSSQTLAPVDEHGYMVSSPGSSLKRTQSGSRPSDREMPAMTLAAPIEDPKKAKKEAELARREAEKAKREAAARMQKERARAVMMKRQQMLNEQVSVKDPHIEYKSGFTVTPETKPSVPQVQAHPPPISQHASASQSTRSLHNSPARDLRHTSTYPMSQSATSVRSHESKRSAAQGSLHSGHSQSHPSLPLKDPLGLPSRHKARRRDDDDDHSMSSFDHNSLRSRSVLTVGTIDSDPGPMNHHRSESHLPFAYSKDPLLAKRSMSSMHQMSSRLANMSNPSLESQLAHDFQARATVASGSTTSLGQHGRSTASLGQYGLTRSTDQYDMMTHQNQLFANAVGGQGSAPTSPYGHPKGTAVSHGVGMGRHAPMPHGVGMTIQEGQEVINPMFQVVSTFCRLSLPQTQGLIVVVFFQPAPASQEQNNSSGTTLPPFSAIARVADSSHQHQQQQQHR